ncbi:MAG: 2-amino-4-hydroxy-6-hydroxymethyldihydropteridine diphosphokinase [Longimicrobiales bacterium]
MIGTGGPAAPGSEAAGGRDAGVPVFLGLGANLGDPLAQLARAVRALTVRFGDLRTSGVYRSRPEDGSRQPDYLNAAVRLTTLEPPDDVLAFGARLEDEAGRVRARVHGARPLDVDLLFYGDLVCATPRLTLPHPRWARRPFVVLPLLDLDPRWVDPSSGRSVASVAAERGWTDGSLTRVLPPGRLGAQDGDS